MLSQRFFFLLLLTLLTFISHANPLDNSHEIVEVISSQPDGLHPINSNSSNRERIFNYTQRTLTRIDPATYELTPILIKSIPKPQDDGVTYLFEIKEGVRWDNGEALTAKDVLFSIKMIFCPLSENDAVRSFYTRVIENVSLTENPNSFILKSRGPQSRSVEIFSDIYIMQASYWDTEGVLESYSIPDLHNVEEFHLRENSRLEKLLEEVNHQNKTFMPSQLVGLGPYQVIEWETDWYIRLERKENWWGEGDNSRFQANYPLAITFWIQLYNDSIEQYLKQGTIDVSTQLGVSRTQKLMEDKEIASRYRVKFIPEFAYSYIGFNMQADSGRLPFFKEKKIRRALALATPCKKFIDSVYYGVATRGISNVSPLKPEFNDALKPLPYDLEKAKSILDEAGWLDVDGDGIREKNINGKLERFSFKLNYFGQSSNSKWMAETIAKHYELIGIEVSPSGLDFTVLYKNAYEGDFDAMFGVWGASAGHSDPRMLWHTESQGGQGSNFFGFGDNYSDSLIEAIGTTVNIDERNDLSRKLQQVIYDEQPYIFLYHRAQAVIYKRDLKNVVVYSAKPNVLLNSIR